MSHVEYVWDRNKRQFLDFVPPISILVAGLVFIIGTAIAIFLYSTPNGKYQFFNQYFSELGVRHNYIDPSRGTTVYAPQYHEIFNLSLIVSGFLVIPFFPFTYRQMRNRSRISRYLFLISIFFGTMSGPLLICVGIFDLSVSPTSFYLDHHFWAAALYLFISLASVFWLLGITFAKDLPYQSSKVIFVDYILILILMVNIIVSFIDNIGLVKLDKIPLFNKLPIEAYQKFIAYTFFIYYGLIVGLRLLNTKYDNTPGLREIVT